MSDADAGHRALANIVQLVEGRDLVEPVSESPIEDEPAELDLWERLGRTLREHDPGGYRELRALGLSLCAMHMAPVEN